MRSARSQELDRWLAHALRHLTPNSGAWRLARKLREWRRSMPHVHPSQRWMAEQLDVSDRSVRRWTRELEAVAGCLVVTRHRPHHGPDGRWRRRTNGYRPCFRKSKIRNERKPLVTPTGHACPHDAPGGASEPAAAVPAPPPWIAQGISRTEWLVMVRTE